MDKIDEVKLTVVEAKAPSLDVDTRTFVVKPSMYKWSLHNGSYLVMEPRYNQHDMLYLNSSKFIFELVTDTYGDTCLQITAKGTE